MTDRGPVQGRPVRRASAILVGVVMLVLLAALSSVPRLFRGRGDAGESTVRAGSSTSAPWSPYAGRLAYTTFEVGGTPVLQQKIWVLDLGTGELAEGPLVPAAEELTVVGRDRSSLLLVADDLGRGGIAYLVEDLSADAAPTELARGALLSVSNRADALVIGRTRPIVGRDVACAGQRYRISRLAPLTGAERLLARGRVTCGRLVSVTGIGADVYGSILRRGVPEIRVASGGRLRRAVVGMALVSAGPDGTRLEVGPDAGLLRSLGVWPGTPTGTLEVRAQPLVRGLRLFAQRVVAWSRDGRALVVTGIEGGDRAMWLVDAEQGSPTLLLPANSFPVRSAFAGASFDDEGNAFAGGPGTIVVGRFEGAVTLPLPPEAPSPAGPVAWLP